MQAHERVSWCGSRVWLFNDQDPKMYDVGVMVGMCWLSTHKPVPTSTTFPLAQAVLAYHHTLPTSGPLMAGG